MPPLEASAPSQDVLINQYALQHAELQAASKALLAGSDSEDSEDERQQEQRMKPRSSELIGIGYAPPLNATDDDGLTSRQESTATQRLRRQLLGKHARPPAGAVGVGGNMLHGGGHGPASKPRPRAQVRKIESEDEDEGRASLGKRKGGDMGKNKNGKSIVAGDVQGNEDLDQEDADVPAPVKVVATTQTSAAVPSTKRGTSYLDQVLAERASKKKRKKRKKQSGIGETNVDQ